MTGRTSYGRRSYNAMPGSLRSVRFIRAIEFTLVLFVFVLIKALLVYYFLAGLPSTVDHARYPEHKKGSDPGI